MNALVIAALLVVQTSTGQSTVWDNLSTEACAEAASAVNRGMSVREAAASDERAAQQEAERQAAWERQNPRAKADCDRLRAGGTIYTSSCQWDSGISVSSGTYYSAPPFTKWARCVK